tara:strand:- start:2803 stop:3420 length:618 start_codon:yes stop_codon:yes gene_type:complete
MIKGLKICGISDSKTLKYIINHSFPPNYIGFISNYKKSKRFVKYENLKELLNVKKKKLKFVSVLVKPSYKILDKIKNLKFDYYQLYGVNPMRTKKIKKKYKIKIITALTIKNKNDVNRYKDYLKISDIILFDGKGYEKSISFNHQLLNNVPKSLNKMIAGNIKIEDIPNLKNKDYIVDLSGSLENKKGKKDIKKINKLLNLANKL